MVGGGGGTFFKDMVVGWMNGSVGWGKMDGGGKFERNKGWKKWMAQEESNLYREKES